MKKVFVLVLLVAFLGGCATFTYVTPTGTTLKYTSILRKIDAKVSMTTNTTTADVSAGVDPQTTDMLKAGIEIGKAMAATSTL
jgi:hypothetical protein